LKYAVSFKQRKSKFLKLKLLQKQIVKFKNPKKQYFSIEDYARGFIMITFVYDYYDYGEEKYYEGT
jgi:hypothetical protein